jgi:oligoribonuclease NrnB/cAMP/cGMP phosphodiesterase (DHH superfamily)
MIKFRSGRKNKLFATHCDLDGYSCYYLAWHYNKFNGYDKIIALDYGYENVKETVDIFKAHDIIHIADHSMEEDLVRELLRIGKEIHIYDHHTSSEYLKEIEHENFHIWHDESRCGTKLYFEEWIKKTVPQEEILPIIEQYVTLVDTYDLWQDETELWPEALNLNNVFYQTRFWGEEGLDSVLPFFNVLDRKVDNWKNWDWTTKEKEKIEISNKKIQEEYEKALSKMDYRKDQKGNQFAVFPLISKISIVASMILKEKPFLDYLLIANMYGGLNGKFSGRSRNGFDCTSLALLNGHTAAAGGETTPDYAKKFLEDSNMVPIFEEDYQDDDKFFIIHNQEGIF